MAQAAEGGFSSSNTDASLNPLAFWVLHLIKMLTLP